MFKKYISGLLFLLFLTVVAGMRRPGIRPWESGKQGSFKIVTIGPGDADLITVGAHKAHFQCRVLCRSKGIEKTNPPISISAANRSWGGDNGLFRYYGEACPKKELFSRYEGQREKAPGPHALRRTTKKGRANLSVWSGMPSPQASMRSC